MATYTITTPVNIDSLLAKTGDDTYNVNGGFLTIDQDTRYGVGANTSAAMGPVNLSATLGGSLLIDGRAVRLIPYDTGAGNVPVAGTVISQGGASGVLIGVYSSLSVAPTTAGSAMPASGFIKIRQWNSVAYAAGALTGIGASATGPDVVGWIEVVGCETRAIAANRVNNTTSDMVVGEWYQVGVTGGSRSDTYQIPSNGALQYHGGVWVETAVGSNEYEFYPVTNQTATVALVGTEAVRGKWCWISTAGVLRFGHDGTNSTGGFLPASGLKIRMPNVFLASATIAARTVNSLNATLTSRFRIAPTSGGRVVLKKCSSAWGVSYITPQSVTIEDTSIVTGASFTTSATPLSLTNVGIGTPVLSGINNLSIATSPEGGTFNDVVVGVGEWNGANKAAISISDSNNLEFNNLFVGGTGARASSNNPCILAQRTNGMAFNGVTLGVGTVSLASAIDTTFNDVVAYAAGGGYTQTNLGAALFSVTSVSLNCVIDGVTFGGLDGNCHRVALLSSTTSCDGITLRNVGSELEPLNGGHVYEEIDAAWTRSGTTVTVTTAAPHDYRVGDVIVPYNSSNAVAITTSSKTITAVTSTSFTFTGASSGTTSGVVSFYGAMCSSIVTLASSVVNVKVQRVWIKNNVGSPYNLTNTNKNVVIDNVYSEMKTTSVSTPTALNQTTRSLAAGAGVHSAQSSVYGTIWQDGFTQDLTMPNSVVGASWTRSAGTITVTSPDHGLTPRRIVTVVGSTSAAAVPPSLETITYIDKDTFSFTGANSGATSGTLEYVCPDSHLTITAHEPSPETADQFTINSGSPQFTAAESLTLFTVGDKVTWETPDYIIGYDHFANSLPWMGGGNINNYIITYDIDRGSGYSGTFQNLQRRITGATWTGGATTVTLPSTVGINVDDFVFAAGMASHVKVVSVDSSTDITVSAPHISSGSGSLIFCHLGNETALPSTGFKLKVSMEVETANTAAFVYLIMGLNSTSTSRSRLYPLDEVPVSITATETDGTPIEDARVYVYADSGGPLSAGDPILNALTNVSGVASGTTEYLGDQPIRGRVRKGSAPFFKTSPFSGTITSDGFSTTVLMVPDE